jgi:hypothetical protein
MNFQVGFFDNSDLFWIGVASMILIALSCRRRRGGGWF